MKMKKRWTETEKPEEKEKKEKNETKRMANEARNET